MMNLFARILSHGFGLIVVALLVIGFIYRGELFPEWDRPDFLALDATTEQATEAASGDVKRASEPVAEDTAADGAVEAAAPAPVEASAEMAEVETVTTEAAAELADESVSAPVEPAPEMEAEEAALAETVAGDAGVVDSTVTGSAATQAEAVPELVEALEVVADEAEPVTDTDTETPPVTTQEAVTGQADTVPAPAAAVGSSYQVLAAAREAYWLRDYALAEQKYQDLIALEPGNPDGYGELGNMYFSQGNWEQAAAAYYEAGVRLVDQGLVREARQLVEVIRGLNGSQADALEQKTRSAEQ
jgi:hypothetical protein